MVKDKEENVRCWVRKRQGLNHSVKWVLFKRCNEMKAKTCLFFCIVTQEMDTSMDACVTHPSQETKNVGDLVLCIGCWMNVEMWAWNSKVEADEHVCRGGFKWMISIMCSITDKQTPLQAMCSNTKHDTHAVLGSN